MAPQADLAELCVTRTWKYQGAIAPIKITIDGTEVGAVSNGKELHLHIPPGKHTVQLKLPLSFEKTTMVSLYPGDTAHLVCSVGMFGLSLTNDHPAIGAGPQDTSEPAAAAAPAAQAEIQTCCACGATLAGAFNFCSQCGAPIQRPGELPATSEGGDPWQAEATRRIAAWLTARHYRIGARPGDIDLDTQAEVAGVVAEVVGSMLGTDMRTSVAGGAGADAATAALEPYIPLCDIIGLQLPGFALGKYQHLLLFVWADSLPPAVIAERFAQYIAHADPVAKLGVRVNYESAGLYIHPLLIYRDATSYAGAVATLLPKAWRSKTWDRVYLKAGFVSVPHQTILWPTPTGIAGLASSLGMRAEPFGEADVREVFGIV
jgi:hypothetical protein